MITGKETQKMQEYTQEQIDRAEHMEIEIPADVKEQIFEYANLIGEEEKVRTLVRNLTDAINQADEDKVEELLDDAKMDIQDLPDPTIGKLELRDYGYTAEDMVPLRKEAALDYHIMGSKIYCLDSDGGKGEYASKEMIQTHEGLFGMELQIWERIRDQDLDYADEDFGAFQEPMSVIDQEEALKLYDAGADIYLITNFSSPVYVTERKEIERGPEHYQMSMAERERFRNLEWEMQKYPQIRSLKEANLLLGTRRTFGIYQIKDDSPGENYAFMNMSFIESHGMQIKKEDYELVYVGELFGNMSLDDIFERFNIDRPKDFRGHSLSVSDIVVLNDGEKVTAHFVDSISFEQLDSFLNLEEQVLSELAYEVGERYFAIQRTEEGYDYSFYDEDFRLMDGGVYENDEISIEKAAEELLEDEGWTGERIRGDYDQLMEKVEEMDEVVMAEIQKSQGEYKPLAKVEELEEANYNMIDNVLNNMPQRIISREYISGEYLEKDYIKAKKYIEMAAEKGDAEAQFTLGRYYISEMGFDNEQKCFEWFQKAAEQGFVEAEYAVGGCYENELGVKQDYAQANYWYQIAVNDGHKRAAYDLGINYLKGQGIEKDVEAGIQLLEIASNGDVHEACRELATRYHYGIPNFRGQALYKNPSEAQRLASIAVQDESDGKAQYILAKIIEEDFGNPQAAIEWYRKAVLNENKEAMLGLSRIYINTQSNCQEAVQMLSKLISEKNGEAQYLYAQCLENGYGCTKDKREAKKYYQLAQSNGYEGAKRKKRFGLF